jgi:hypothetical protein
MDVKVNANNIYKNIIVSPAPSMAQGCWQMGLKKRHITGRYMLRRQ